MHMLNYKCGQSKTKHLDTGQTIQPQEESAAGVQDVQ